MKRPVKRAYSDLEHMRQAEFQQKCRLIKQSHFTRNRKMPLRNLILSIPFRKGRTLHVELKYFKEIFRMDSDISKPGYLKQRLKLNPEAIRDLMRFHARIFYEDTGSVSLWKHHMILAVDGTSCNIPSTEENISLYGNASRHGTKERPQIGVSCLFDVLNRMVIDLSADAWKFDERSRALQQIDAAEEVIGRRDGIYLFDRGYPSGIFFMDLMERKKLFVTRLTTSTFRREQKAMKTDDEWMDVRFDDGRIRAHTQHGRMENASRMTAAGKIRLRFVKVEQPDGGKECLVTNLTKGQADTAEIAQLYRMRWGIESAFDDMKNKLEMENFTGSKRIIMEQDIYACGYLYNLINDFMQDAQRDLPKPAGTYKYPMRINKNVAIGVMKESLIRMFLEQDKNIQKKILDGILQEIQSNLLPVRENRQYERADGQLASNYSNVRKRSY